ncbi:MAG: glycosyltransferase family 39 protein [Chloroflexia bacterium]|nr:glycosyltransferase family 39 protein [Chloroflexia bacterium]
MSASERDPRRWFTVAMLLVLLHGAFYAVAIPPWDLFDEEQHLDYALTLRDERRIPSLAETVRLSIVQSAVDTDRWTVFQIGRPPSTEPEEMGLEGRSFEGYQPPLYYMAIAPLTLPAGDSALPALYMARSFGVLLLVIFSATAWALARRWFPERRVWTPFSAAVMTGAVPAAAEAAGRVNNDLMSATLIGVGLLATLRLIDRPDMRNGAVAGLVAAAAILTKSPGLLALGVVAVGLGLVWRRGRLTPTVAVAAIGPGAAAFLLWTAFIYERYGVLTGTSAFLDLVVPFDPLPVSEFFIRVWLNGWSSYWGAYDGGWLRVLIGVAGLGVIGVATYGLSRGDALRFPYDGVVFTGALGIGLLAVLWVGNTSGLVHPHGRIMLPVYPALAALTAGGWARLHRRWALAPAGIVCLGALISAGFWFLPFFYGATS